MRKSALYFSENLIITTCIIVVYLSSLFFTSFSTSLVESLRINRLQVPIQANVMAYINIPWEELSYKDKSQYLENILLSVLYPYIQEPVTKHYGEVRQFDASIISIKPIGLAHEIQVQASTFVGPHNPPYGLDTITLLLDGSNIKVIDFKHKDLD